MASSTAHLTLGDGATAQKKASARRQIWMVIVIGLAIALAYIDKSIVALLVAPIKADIGLSDTQMSVILGLSFGAAYTLVSLPAGFLADRFDRRIIIVAGIMLWCVMTAGAGLATSFAGLLLTRTLVGLGEGAIVPAAASMIREGVDPDRRARAYSVMVMAPFLGIGLAMLAGGPLIAMATAHGPFDLPLLGVLQPWQMVLVGLGLGGLPLCLLLFTTFEPERRAISQGGRVSFGDAMRHVGDHWGLYIPLFLFSTMNGLSSSIYGAWIPTLVSRTFNMGFAEIGRALGLAILIAIPTGLFLAGLIMDRVRRRSPLTGPALVAVVGAFIVSITATVTPLVDVPQFFWVSYGIQLLLGGVPAGAAQVILANATPADRMGKVQGIYMLLTGLAGLAIGPTLAAWTGDTFFAGPRSLNHGMSFVCAIAGTAAFISALFVFRAARRASLIDASAR